MLATAASALAITLALLVIPVRISFDAEPRRWPALELSLSWFFGLVRCRLTAAKDLEPSAPTATQPRSMAVAFRRGAAALLRSSGVAARLRRLVRDLVTSFRPEIEWLRVELGLAEPADTGRVWAVAGPVSGWLMHRYPGRIRLEPNFARSVVTVEGHAQLTVIPLQTLAILVGFIASPSVVRGLYAMYFGSQR